MTTLAVDYAERRRWQQDAVAALNRLLAADRGEPLPPPVPWTVLSVGILIGRAETKEQVLAWADFLAAKVVESMQADGSLACRCDTVWDGVIPVTVVAD
jgi:hypothetical protein